MQPIPPPEEEALVPEELETEGSQKQEEEEEEDLGILQYLDQLEQVTASFLGRLVLLWKPEMGSATFLGVRFPLVRYHFFYVRLR